MNFAILFSPEAENDLAECWLLCDDRKTFNSNLDTLETSLCRNPSEKGAELSEGLFVFQAGLLRVFFEIHELEKEVEITKIQLVARK